MRWPAEWRDAGALDLLNGTPVGILLFPSTEGYEQVIERARQLHLTVGDIGHPPPGVEAVKGEWPGIRMSPGQGDASSGPTGAPWIDSNGWLVRLTRVRKPNSTVWLAADPPKSNLIVPLSRHLVALADTAAHGGRWVVTLDKGMADGLAARTPGAVRGWRRLMDAMAFFHLHEEWGAWPADAVLAVVSDFSGDNEFFSHELLNLTARTNVSYRILLKDSLQPEALAGLRAAVYPDAGPPPADVRRMLMDFAARGGLLIAGPKWGGAPGTPAAGEPHPRYQMKPFGRGRMAVAHQQPEDPYEMAQDVQILLSHRHDLVRFFNGFLLGAYATVSPDGRRRLEHIVNYGGGPGYDPATARIAGRFRAAKLWSCERAEARPLPMLPQGDAVEVHLPRLDVYGGIELEA